MLKNMKKTVLFLLLFPSLVVTSQASAATYDVLGGSFFIEGSMSEPLSIVPGDPGQLIEGAYQGPSEIVADFNFFFNPTYVYTASTGDDGLDHAAPSIDLGSMSADMGSWYWWYGGTEFNQGGIATVADNKDGTYHLEWSAVLGGPLGDTTGYWQLDVSAVPEPASLLLIGSGLVGLVGFGKQKKV